VQEEHRDEVKRVTDRISEKLGIHVDLFPVSEDQEDFGPCESMRELLVLKKIHVILSFLIWKSEIRVNLKVAVC